MTHPVFSSHFPRTVLRNRRSRGFLAAALGIAALAPVLALSATSGAAVARHSPRGDAGAAAPLVSPHTPWPDGVISRGEPSHLAPPGPHALRGYVRTYVDDFQGSLNRDEWYLFRGQPGGDPAGYFAASHVKVVHGVLTVSTYRDPAYHDNWVGGGAGLYRIHPEYGAYFVRSRQVGTGPDTVELLWPTVNEWPPEIDFNETGNHPTLSTWTVHYDSPSDQHYYEDWHINLHKWHTWGVIWTPTSLRFTLDGRQWGPTVTAPSQIPHIPMEFDVQQQTWCGINADCPTSPSSVLVDWIAIYQTH